MEIHQHRKLACLEEIAYINEWVSKEAVAEKFKNNQYGQYLKDVLAGKYIDPLR